MQLTITLEVKDDIEAYQIVNKLSWEHKVVNSTYNKLKYTFDDVKKPKDFLKPDFNTTKVVE